MGIDKRLALSLDSLSVDVFDVVGGEQTVESLTAGHGMTELGGSTNSCSCSCSYVPPMACSCSTDEPI